MARLRHSTRQRLHGTFGAATLAWTSDIGTDRKRPRRGGEGRVEGTSGLDEPPIREEN